jgi:hypothetical protein
MHAQETAFVISPKGARTKLHLPALRALRIDWLVNQAPGGVVEMSERVELAELEPATSGCDNAAASLNDASTASSSGTAASFRGAEEA